jgi:hypothetical protein
LFLYPSHSTLKRCIPTIFLSCIISFLPTIFLSHFKHLFRDNLSNLKMFENKIGFYFKHGDSNRINKKYRPSLR